MTVALATPCKDATHLQHVVLSAPSSMPAPALTDPQDQQMPVPSTTDQQDQHATQLNSTLLPCNL